MLGTAPRRSTRTFASGTRRPCEPRSVWLLASDVRVWLRRDLS